LDPRHTLGLVCQPYELQDNTPGQSSSTFCPIFSSDRTLRRWSSIVVFLCHASFVGASGFDNLVSGSHIVVARHDWIFSCPIHLPLQRPQIVPFRGRVVVTGLYCLVPPFLGLPAICDVVLPLP
jgi:hypothetical protein